MTHLLLNFEPRMAHTEGGRILLCLAWLRPLRGYNSNFYSPGTHVPPKTMM
jgi:hypothetical protein